MSRRVSYVPDGVPRRVAVATIIETWPRYSTRIRPEYALATADHESGRAENERDEEPPDEHDNIYVSDGIFQISRVEAIWVKRVDADLFSLADSCDVFARLQEERLDAILKAAALTSPTPDCFAFLSVAHNQGIGAAVKSIEAHGCDWTAYKARNISAAETALEILDPGAVCPPAMSHTDACQAVAVALGTVAHARAKLAWWHSVARYGDDCITGGPHWPAS